jgi:regulator of protease activity HflC (stomatin/prohibitin superfamily)
MKFKKNLQLTSLRVFILDLQNVNITLRVLFRPVPTSLPNIYSTLGIDYDERVLPSITNEILKAVVVRLYIIFFSF